MGKGPVSSLRKGALSCSPTVWQGGGFGTHRTDKTSELAKQLIGGGGILEVFQSQIQANLFRLRSKFQVSRLHALINLSLCERFIEKLALKPEIWLKLKQFHRGRLCHNFTQQRVLYSIAFFWGGGGSGGDC